MGMGMVRVVWMGSCEGGAVALVAVAVAVVVGGW